MSTKRLLLTILAAGAVVLAVGIGPRITGNARALPPAPAGATIPYSGRLTDEAGQPVSDGAYGFAFALYAAESGGEPVWAETQEAVTVQGGAFTALLGSVAPLPQEALDGGARWLEVSVRGPGEDAFTQLSPRQELSASAAQAGVAALPNGPSCEHTHWGEIWYGSGNGLVLQGDSDTYATLYVRDISPNGGYGVHGHSDYGVGVYGQSDSTGGKGVYGQSDSTGGKGVYGYDFATSGENYGVYGRSNSTAGMGVLGRAAATTGTNYGVYGRSDSTGGVGVVGHATAITGVVQGVIGRSDSPIGRGVAGVVYANSGINYGVYGWTQSPAGYAGYFDGNVHVAGTLSKSAGSFMIDHPLDPQHKYLYHSFVESPDMKNIYDGVVTLGEDGTAWVQLPEWFQALNQDFRYQLTPIGAAMPNLHIAEEIQGNQFKIAGGVSGKKVSWQVTGIRHDPYAEQHRIPVEQDKPADEQGTYLYPEGYGQPQEMGLDYQRNKHLFEWPETEPLFSGDE